MKADAAKAACAVAAKAGALVAAAKVAAVGASVKAAAHLAPETAESGMRASDSGMKAGAGGEGSPSHASPLELLPVAVHEAQATAGAVKAMADFDLAWAERLDLDQGLAKAREQGPAKARDLAQVMAGYCLAWKMASCGLVLVKACEHLAMKAEMCDQCGVTV